MTFTLVIIGILGAMTWSVTRGDKPSNVQVMAWLLFGAFAIAEWGNFERGHDLTAICDDLSSRNLFGKVGQKANRICGDRGYDAID